MNPLADEASEVHASNPFEEKIKFSIFTKSKGNLTKTMRLDPETGKVLKDGSQCKMFAGTVKTAKLTSPEGCARMLRYLASNQAIAHGICGFDHANIVTAGKVSAYQTKPGERPTIARTKEYFQYPAGPAMMVFDHDAARQSSVAENDKALKPYRPDELLEVRS